jgi:hypothetical protein
MVSFDEKVSTFQEENEQVRTKIVSGSDEHLDILLEIKKLIDPLTESWRAFFKSITKDLNDLDEKDLVLAVPKLLDLYASAIKLVATLKRSRIKTDLKITVQDFCSEVDNLHEVIYDIERYRLNDDEQIKNLLDQINEL